MSRPAFGIRTGRQGNADWGRGTLTVGDRLESKISLSAALFFLRAWGVPKHLEVHCFRKCAMASLPGEGAQQPPATNNSCP